MQGLTINIDGAARGNPGPSAFAYVLSRDGQPPVEHAGCLGTATNNVAEYTALVRALERAAELGAKRLVVRSDSELLVKQMNGEYKVKNAALRALYDQAQDLLGRFEEVTLQHVRRAQNKRADQLCNEALDGRFVPDAALPASPLQGTAQAGPGKLATEATRRELLALLRRAQTAWARGQKNAPTPEEVGDEIWGLLLAEGVVRLSLDP